MPRFREAGLGEPLREASVLLRHLQPDGAPGSPVDRSLFEAGVARRAAREPMAFITGTKGFWTLDLAVSPHTLIPRPDSETLVEAAVAYFRGKRPPDRVLDLGTGTGCLLLAVLSEFPDAFGVGGDINPGAAALAASNARQTGLAGRATFLAADWASCLAAGFDLVLCNPPYIETAVIAGLMPEVAGHEPRRALDGGPDGLAAYAALMPQVRRLLGLDGIAIFELGQGQQAAVQALAEEAGLAHLHTQADLAGVPRALVAGVSAPEKTVWQEARCPLGS